MTDDCKVDEQDLRDAITRARKRDDEDEESYKARMNKSFDDAFGHLSKAELLRFRNSILESMKVEKEQ